ncbi:MAG TPA: sigma 54-interacting transcriptional regulator [Thermoanaerobaculia bacterium]|nr:sigma 54-interacting transcriptional regulator [Thermoanaerobaculia bacterium]
MLSFEVRKPGGESEIRKVHRDVIHLGASSGNDLVVRARGVLGRHARISVAGEELRLDVLGTAPGSDVYLNGAIVKSAALAAGDRIQIGEATITLLNGPAPNPNRIAAPPPRGRDAFSVASAALSPLPPAPAPPAPSAPRAPEPRPRSYEPVHAVRPAENRSLSAAQGFRLADVWGEIFGRLRASATLEERLQEVASYLSSSTPVHSVAFLSVADSSTGEAIAAIWKGTLPRLGRRSVDEVFAAGGPTDVFEAGMRLRVYPVTRPGAEAVGLLVLPMELAADPLLNDLAVALAAAIGFVHAERADAPFGERASAHAPAAMVTAPLEDPVTAVVGSSLAIQNLRVSLQRIASARAPVLVIGDVGTGKTLVAETLHALSPRRPRPLVRISATASTAAALEEDLLGTAGPPDRRRRPGRLFEADGGTLLIEEVSELPAPTQALLYRLLEAREVVAPGGRSVPVDVRVIGTSSRPLTRAVEEGTFRDDLYYRLSALTLRLPTLRDRKEDIPALLDAFAARHGGPPAAAFDVEAMNALLDFNYAGNVREVENEVRRLAAQLGAGPVRLSDLDAKFGDEHVELTLAESDDLKEIVEKVERQVIERVMRKVRGNQSLGARLLNISRGSLIAKMKEYDIKDFRYLKRQD